MTNYRNPVLANAGGSRITCEIEHPTFGWIPFTAASDDPDPIGRALFTLIAVEGMAAPYAPTDTQVDLHAHLSQIRQEYELAGVSVTIGADTLEIETDERSQTKILGARVAANNDPGFTTQFSAANGYFLLDAAGVIAVSNAVLAHINSSFAAKAVVAAQIEAGTLTATAEVEAAFEAAVGA